MSSRSTAPAPHLSAEAGVGTPLAVGGSGMSIFLLGMPDAGQIDADAVTVLAATAFGTGFVGLLIGGRFALLAVAYLALGLDELRVRRRR